MAIMGATSTRVNSMQLRRYSTFFSGSPNVTETEERSMYWASVPAPPALQTSQVYPPSKLRSICTVASHFSAASVKLAAASAPVAVMAAPVNPENVNGCMMATAGATVGNAEIDTVPGYPMALLLAGTAGTRTARTVVPAGIPGPVTEAPASPAVEAKPIIWAEFVLVQP